jgi:hypothetical protein
VAHLTAHRAELAAGIDGVAADDEPQDRAGEPGSGRACIRVPARRLARRLIHGCDVVPCCAADRREDAAGVDVSSRDRECIDVEVGIGIPSRDASGGRIDRGDVVAERAADRIEGPTHVRGIPGHPDRPDRRKPSL